MLLAWALWSGFPCAAIAQIAILNLRVVEGEGTVFRAGSRTARSLVVEVTDETGRPQSGVAVSFHLPEDGPSGLLANGLRTDLVLTDAAGRAVLRGLQVNRISGPFRIRITAVKEQARAGIISLQYISGTEWHSTQAPAPAGPRVPGVQPAPATRPAAPVRIRRGISRKWIILGAIAAGAAAGGIYAGAAGAKSASGAAAAGVSIGSPTITLGKP
jgi:hypothetical protein